MNTNWRKVPKINYKFQNSHNSVRQTRKESSQFFTRNFSRLHFGYNFSLICTIFLSNKKYTLSNFPLHIKGLIEPCETTEQQKSPKYKNILRINQFTTGVSYKDKNLIISFYTITMFDLRTSVLYLPLLNTEIESWLLLSFRANFSS